MSAGGKRIDTIVQSPDTLKLSSIFSNKLFVLDGKKVDNSILELLDPSKIDNIRVLKGQEATTLYGEEGKNGVVLIKSKITKTILTADTIITHGNFDGATFSVTASGTKKPQVSMSFDDSGWIANDGKRHPFSPQPLYIVNGSKPTAKTGTLRIDDIISINILSGKDATDKYGSEGKNGVIEITTKPDTDVNDNPTTTATSVPIATYITAKTIPSPAVNVSNASLVSYPDLTNDLSKKYPAVIKSHLAVKAGYVGVKMSSASPQDDVSAHFPGGSEAWVKYLERNINRNILIKNGAPPGKYKVIVSFDVDMNGELTNIRAETDPGYGTKDEAIRLIAKGPKWIPATKDGKAIATNHKQAISFVRSEPK
jgi:TonB-dependent SusC/RagA subfamily outer membrane receptor